MTKSKIREIISERFQKNETDSGIQGLLKELRTKVTESDLGEDDAADEVAGQGTPASDMSSVIWW